MKNQKQSVRNVVALVAVLFSMVGSGLAEAQDQSKAPTISTKAFEVPTAVVNPQILNPRPACQNRVVPEGLESVSNDLYCCAVTDREARLSCLDRNNEKTRAVTQFLSRRVNTTLFTAISNYPYASYGSDQSLPDLDSYDLGRLIEWWEDELTRRADRFSEAFAEFGGLVDQVRSSVRR